MLPTPDTSHIGFTNIYEPAEDSYLILDTLAAPHEIAYLQHRFARNSSSLLVVEVGTGSGVVLAFVATQAQTLFGRPDVLTLGTDVNRYACEAAQRTMRLNVNAELKTATGSVRSDHHAFIGCLNMDLATALRPHTVDVLIFNPPYVPSERVPIQECEMGETKSSHEVFERDSRLLALATDGGTDGMQVTDRLLDMLPEVLSDRGVAYVLLCAQNRPEQVKRRIQVWGNCWDVQTVKTSGKQGGWEKLQVIRISRVFS